MAQIDTRVNIGMYILCKTNKIVQYGIIKVSEDVKDINHTNGKLPETTETAGNTEEYDPWAIDTKESDDGPKWEELSCCQKITYIITVLLKVVFIFGFLYLFICSLGFLSDAFQLVGGKTAGKAFQDNELLSNPAAGLMIGLLVTALLQSSSTTTSIIITMVGSEIIPIKAAIPMVMGANIGTSITNTIVSLAQSVKREEFRKAFGGATVHDMFNWLTAFILLPLEMATGYLYHLTGAIIDSLNLSKSGENKELLNVITKPFTRLIVKVDNDVITNIALNKKGADTDSVLYRWCKTTNIPYNETVSHRENYNSTLAQKLNISGISYSIDENGTFIDWTSDETLTRKINVGRCDNLFAKTDLSDEVVGAILLAISLTLIVVSLVFMVKLINSLLQGSIAKLVKKMINADFPGRLRFLTGYVAILFGAGLTMIIQSSSVFTSALTPLVGAGVVSIDRMYALTLGSNIGTCLTGILAALANPADAIKRALQISLCHLFFNISGTILFYPIPFTRKAPINLAKALGNITAKYRWFSILYIVMMFIVFPGAVFALSVAGTVVFIVVGSVILFTILCIISLNILQRKCQKRLPKCLRNWKFLPLCCRSLEPYDRIIKRILRLFWCKKSEEEQNTEECDTTVTTL